MISKIWRWNRTFAKREEAHIRDSKPGELTWEEKEPLYASHVPVLLGLARLLTVRRVLELGAGYYSTSVFLNREAFGDLQALHSVEDDPVWAAEMYKALGGDPRAVLLSVPAPVREALSWIWIPYHDFIFVDNSTLIAERAATIRRLSEQCGASTVVVVHDYEQNVYQETAAGFRNRFAFTALTPNTGVAWNDAPVEPARLEELNALIAAHKDRMKPQDITGWLHTMDILFQPLR